MKKIRYFIVSTIVLCMIFASTIVTYAADPYLSFGSKTGNVNVKKYADKYNDTWVSVIDNGIILVQIYQFQNLHLAKILLKQHDMMIHGMD